MRASHCFAGFAATQALEKAKITEAQLRDKFTRLKYIQGLKTSLFGPARLTRLSPLRAEQTRETLNINLAKNAVES